MECFDTVKETADSTSVLDVSLQWTAVMITLPFQATVPLGGHPRHVVSGALVQVAARATGVISQQFPGRKLPALHLFTTGDHTPAQLVFQSCQATVVFTHFHIGTSTFNRARLEYSYTLHRVNSCQRPEYIRSTCGTRPNTSPPATLLASAGGPNLVSVNDEVDAVGKPNNVLR